MTQTDYDMLSRVKDVIVAGVEVQDNIYDNSDGNNGTQGGDSNLTKVTLHPGAGQPDRTTRYAYDWRDRQIVSDNGVQLTYDTLNNLDQLKQHDIYDSTSASFSGAFNNGVPAESSDVISSALRARTAYAYDDRGNLSQSTQFSVNPANGAVGASLVTSIFHDGRGNVTETDAPDGLVTGAFHDGAGRLYLTQTGSGASGGSGPSTIISQTQTSFDRNGNPTLVATTENGSTGIATRNRYVAYYYDTANRLKTVADLGSGGATAGFQPPSSIPSTALSTTYTFDAGGHVLTMTDPRGIVTKTENDALGRVFRQITAFSDGITTATSNQITSFGYDGLDHVISSSVYNALPDGTSSSPQTTTYLYGAGIGGGAPSNADLLGGTVYPDLSSDRYARDALGDIITDSARDGSMHTYTYDGIGRKLSDRATAGPGIDAAVTELDYAYDTLNHLTTATSAGSGGIVNQVQLTYNGFGQLISDAQAHGGTVNITTPTVQYGYTGSVLSSITYPSTRVIHFGYDSGMGQISSVSDGSTTLESYGYLGMATVLELSRPLSGGSSISLSTQLDGFGRVMAQSWMKGSSPLAVDTYGYDAGGHLLYDNNITLAGLSTLYTSSTGGTGNSAYTPLGQMQQFQRGTLSSSFTSMSGSISNSLEILKQDTQGNYTSIVEGGTNNVAVTYDAANAVASGNGNASSGGNTTALGANTFGHGLSGVYDAWGRLVKTTTSNGFTETFRYDALNHQISQSEDAYIGLSHITTSREFYLDAGGDVIQEWNPATGSVSAEYVWSPVTGQIIERDRATTAGGSLAERMYPLYDPQGSTIALVNSSGNVIERYIYDATGQMQALDGSGQARVYGSTATTTGEHDLADYFDTPLSNFLGANPASPSVLGGTDVAWHYYLHGMRYEDISGLYLSAGGQAYNPRLGRWMQPQGNVSAGITYTGNESTSAWSYLPGAMADTVQSNIRAIGHVIQQLGYTLADIGNDALYNGTFWMSYMKFGSESAAGVSFYQGHLSSMEQAIDSGQVDPLSWNYVGQSAENVANAMTFGIYDEGKASVQYAMGGINAEQYGNRLAVGAFANFISAGTLPAGANIDLGAAAAQANAYASVFWEGLDAGGGSVYLPSGFGGIQGLG